MTAPNEALAELVLEQRHSDWQSSGCCSEGRMLCLRYRCNHSFASGNKRTAAVSMAVFLGIDGCRLDPRLDEHYDAMVGIADGMTWDVGCLTIRAAENAKRG